MIKSLKEELFIPFETECLFGHKGSRWTIPRPYLRLRFQYFPIKELQKEAKTKAQLGLFRVPKEKTGFQMFVNFH